MIKIIKIFIASSINEFHNERNELARFVCGINNRFVERGTFCKLVLCENEDQAIAKQDRKQDEYNMMIRDADVVFVLFLNKAGKYTVEELDFARSCFVESGHPKVYTYFKDFSEEGMSDDVRAVYNKIVNEYKHYFGTFEKIETLGIDILRVMFDITLDPEFQITEKNGVIYLGGDPFMDVDEMDYIKNSRHINELKQRLAFLSIDNNAMTEGLYGDELSSEIQKIEAEIKDSYKKCFDVIERRYKDMSNNPENYDLQLQLAYNASAAGDYNRVREILNYDLINLELDIFDKKSDIGQKEALDFFRRIPILINAIIQDKEIDKLGELYKKSVSLIKNHSLFELDSSCLTTWHDYIAFLMSNYDIEGAIKTAEILMGIYKTVEFKDTVECGSLERLLGTLYVTNNQIEDAEDYFEDSVHFFERAVKRRGRSALHINELADSYTALGSFYDQQNRQEAEDQYKNAISLLEDMPSILTEDDKVRFHSIHTVLGHFYNRNERPDLARENYRKALDIQSDLLETTKDSPMHWLYVNTYMTAYLNLLSFTIQQKDFTDAKDLFVDIESLLENSEDHDSLSYKNYLASYHANMAFFCQSWGNIKDAETNYIKAVNLLIEINEKAPHSCDPALSQLYSNFSIMYQQNVNDPENLIKAEECNKKALDIVEPLMEQNPEAYVNSYLIYSSNMAKLYFSTDRPKEANELYQKVLSICQELAKKYPERYNVMLALTYANIGETCLEGDPDSAAKYLHQAITIYESLLESDFQKLFSQYAAVCLALIASSTPNEEEINETTLLHLLNLMSYSQKAFDSIEESSKNPIDLPTAAFYLSFSKVMYGLCTDNDELMGYGMDLASDFFDNPIFFNLCESIGFTDLLIELSGEEDSDDIDDEDDEDCDMSALLTSLLEDSQDDSDSDDEEEDLEEELKNMMLSFNAIKEAITQFDDDEQSSNNSDNNSEENTLKEELEKTMSNFDAMMKAFGQNDDSEPTPEELSALMRLSDLMLNDDEADDDEADDQ